MEFSGQRTLEWVATSYSRGSSPSRDWMCISCVTWISRCILYHCATWEVLVMLCTWQLLLIYLQNTYKNIFFLLKLCFNNMSTWGLPWWLNGKESTFQCRRRAFDSWTGKIPWRKKWPSTPLFFAWKIPWGGGEEPGGLQSMGSQRVGHNWATKQQQWLSCSPGMGSIKRRGYIFTCLL